MSETKPPIPMATFFSVPKTNWPPRFTTSCASSVKSRGHSETIIVEGYKNFLRESADPDEREHIEVHDQVREILIHENYMSLIDLDFCAKCDIAEFDDHPHFAEVEALHAEVKAWVDSEEALAA